MQTRQLGNSDLQITPIGIGAWAMGGGDWAFAWGAQDDQDSINAIHAGLAAGMNWIDTAMVYGHGHSERVVGRAIAGLSKQPYVFTKCSRQRAADGSLVGVLKADSIRAECEASLRNLQVDVIDLYQIHWPIPEEDIEEGWETLARLKDEGKVRWIGVSNFNAAQMERLLPIAPITSLQPPYSLLRREIEANELPFVAAHNIGVIVYSPMQSGLLSGKMTKERVANFPDNDWRKRRDFFQEPQLSRNLALADKLAEIGARHGRTAGEVAIAWTLRRPEVTGAIVGIRTPEQVEGVIGAGEFRLSQEEIDEIETFHTKGNAQ
ncbi:MAG TPA: aldo/keto reductase [Blastocatellia bacterium]|nr:aldo/keto reductase [Blastocatellia bacterium]